MACSIKLGGRFVIYWKACCETAPSGARALPRLICDSAPCDGRTLTRLMCDMLPVKEGLYQDSCVIVLPVKAGLYQDSNESLIRSETNIPFRMSFFVFSALPPRLTMRQKSLGTSAIMRITDQQQCVGRTPCELILAGQCRGKWQSLCLPREDRRENRSKFLTQLPNLSPASPLTMLSSI